MGKAKRIDIKITVFFMSQIKQKNYLKELNLPVIFRQFFNYTFNF